MRATMSCPADLEATLDFVLETRQRLERVGDELRSLAHNPANRAAVCALSREFPSIKGNAAFLEFTDMRALARETERLLEPVRKEAADFTPVLAWRVAGAANSLRQWLEDLEVSLPGAAR